MTEHELDSLDTALASQIGDDVSVIYDHESLFKRSRAALAAMRDERDALKSSNAKLEKEASSYARANHEQALCINFTASALGDEISATIKGLPKAARYVRERADAAEARALAAEAAALERAAIEADKYAYRHGGMVSAAIRDLITSAARTALDAALAEARKAGKLEGLREAAQAADDWFYDPQSDEVTERRLGEKIRARAARVEGGDA